MLRGNGTATLFVVAALGWAGAHTALGQGTPARDSSRVLALTGNVRVAETDTLFIARPVAIALAPNGNVYVSEPGEGRVSEIGPSGRIVRVFGRKGRGPGELADASSLEVAGDSLLLVWDRGQRRLTTYSLRTGDFVRSMPANVAWPPAIRVAGGEILLTTFDDRTATSVLRLSVGGDTLGREGALPPIVSKYPMLAGGVPTYAAIATSGRDVFAMSDLSPALYRWTRGQASAVEVQVPAVRRRGVNTEHFEQMLRDPQNAELTKRLFYGRSMPAAMDMVAPGIVGIVTLDLDMRWEELARGTTYYLSLVDVQHGRACVDILVPAARDIRSDREPMPLVTLLRNTLLILQQDLDKQGESMVTMRRFRIDPSQCTWTSTAARHD